MLSILYLEFASFEMLVFTTMSHFPPNIDRFTQYPYEKYRLGLSCQHIKSY